MINMKNLVLGIGIVIVFALVLGQGIKTFYPSPERGDFCDEIASEPRVLPDGDLVEDEPFKDPFKECQDKFDKAKDAHSKVVFVIAVIIGIIALIVGITILSVEPVGSALLGSGIWAILWGTVINWRNFANIWRFALLLLAFILIIWFALRINKPKKKHR